jgi:hypothetical protein
MKNTYGSKWGYDENFVKAALAMCENIDWNVGRVLKKLDELKIADNTIVLYLSDNGPNSSRWNGEMKGRKGSVDEGGVRSPLHLRWPQKVKNGQLVKEVTGAVDLLPTLTSLAGVNFKPKKKIDGLDFSSLLNGQQRNWDDKRSMLAYWRGKSTIRSQHYRLDKQGRLFDMRTDRAQKNNLAKKLPSLKNEMQKKLDNYLREINEHYKQEDDRPFVICHKDFEWTQIPARDGEVYGGITRSNKHPNCTFFTNWTSLEDYIKFDVFVQSQGEYEVVIYYTCPRGAEGSQFRVSFGDSFIDGVISEAHDPPLYGMEQDYSKRIESYVKDFKALKLGVVSLKEGEQNIKLQALKIPAKQVMDFRLMMLRKID